MSLFETSPLPLEEAWIGQAGNSLTEAFYKDPLFVLLIPDDKERREKLPCFFQFLLRFGALFGEIYVESPHPNAGTIWLTSEMGRDNKERNLQAGAMEMVEELGPRIGERLERWGNFSSRIHHRVAPYDHFYLQILGIHPDYQGQKLSSFLLRPMLDRMDRDNMSCFLETQNPDNLPIYNHFGFEVVDESIFPDSDLISWAMIRKPLS